METRFQTGTVVSAVGHLGVILWVLVGDWLFAADVPPETITMTASTISSEAFAELQAATANPSEDPAPVRPQARPEDVTPPEEPLPEEPPPEEPPPVEEAPPVEDPPPVEEPPVVEEVVPVEPPPSDAPQAVEEQAILSDSTEIQPTPEAETIIASDPVQPETETESSDAPEPAVSEDPVAEEVIQQDPTEASVPEDTGDVTQTEANIEDTAETGMTTSIRPKSRPERPAPQPEPQPEPQTEPDVAAAEDPAPETSTQLTVQPVDDTETADAIDALLGEATDEAVVEEPSGTGGQDLPQGPPLTGGEMGNISSAIARKWNLGAASTDTLSTMIVVRVSFGADGKPADFELLESEGPSQTGIDKLYESARRAVNRAHADGGLPLPADKFDTWRVLDLVFDANGMRTR